MKKAKTIIYIKGYYFILEWKEMVKSFLNFILLRHQAVIFLYNLFHKQSLHV